MSGLRGKIGIVTGAGSGIGRVIAKRLHADGMKLMVADVVQANVDAMVRAPGTRCGSENTASCSR